MRYFTAVLLAIVGCADDDILTSALCNQPCFTQSSTTVGVGLCQYGVPVCDETRTFIECRGEVKPALEICDGLDNNCNGLTDEDFDSDHDGLADCFDEEECDGLDNDGNQLVDEGFDNDQDGFASCKDCDDNNFNIHPQAAEICDGLDNDCNGQIDDGTITEGEVCGLSSVGACELGASVCVVGEDFCPDAVLPENEVCDSLDNDCDGWTDEGLYRPCRSDCGQGVETCAAGDWVTCSAPPVLPELCDGLDNDCDGDVDEGCLCTEGDAQACSSGIIDRDMNPVNCGIGVTFCDAHGQWGPCWSVGTTPEICNNWDDDCDGVVDGYSQPCGSVPNAGIGVCRVGTSTCTAGRWSTCDGIVGPSQEICDHLDNDCDGLIDEDLNPHDKVDIIFAIDWSGSMCPFIQALAQGISAYVQDFIGTDHRFGLVVFPGPGSMTIEVRSAPVTVSQLVTSLSSLSCTGGGLEPSYDVVADLASPLDPYNIGWRSDAHPYVVLITDEPAQTWSSRSEQSVSQVVDPCMIGSCMPGDRLEIFVITYTNYFPQWDDVTPTSMQQSYLIEISPPSASRYTDLLRGVFTNICR